MIQECQRNQGELDQELQDLRRRSTRCLEWWVNFGVVGMGDLWEEWEDRLKDVQQQVSRLKRRQMDKEGYI
jgi:hypothetical protein